tara:strand:- start:257 stop:886 length:630 start_codon:yes stop_codon:yes gene_type:complete
LSRKKEKPVIIFGAGGHSSVLINVLKKLNREILGIIDPALDENSEFLGIPTIDEKSFSDDPKNIEIVNAIGSMPGKNNRKKLTIKLREQGYSFASVIDPSAVIGMNVNLEEGVQILAGVIIQPNVSIGYDTIVNTAVSIDHDCKISSDCHIAPGVIMSGNVNIGSNCHIGTGSVILNNITINRNSLIAGGSTVFEDVKEGATLIQKVGQ